MNEQENNNNIQQASPTQPENSDYFKTPKYIEMKEREGYNQVGFAMIFQFIFLYAITFALILNTNAFFRFFPDDANPMAIISIVSWFTAILAALVSNILPFAICAKKTGQKVLQGFKPGIFNFKTISITCVVCIGVNFLSSFVITAITWLLEFVNVVPMTPSFAFEDSLLTNILLLIFACIVAPITEEFVFRGVLLNVFAGKSQAFGVVVSAALFGLIHGNLAQGIGAFCIGIVFGIIAIKTKSILIPIIGHFFNNSFAMLGEFFLYKDLEGYLVAAGLFMMACGVATVIIGIIMIVKRKKRNELNPPAPKVKHNGVKLLFTSWPMLIAMAIHVTMMLLSTLGILG